MAGAEHRYVDYSDPDDPDFYYQYLDIDDNYLDILKSLMKHDLIGIVNKYDGGIVAYAIGEDHASALVRALNAASGEYEADMVASQTNREDAEKNAS